MIRTEKPSIQNVEGHQWVCFFLLAEEEGYAFEDVQMLSYVPKKSEPRVAFDGLAEMERDQLEGDKMPNIEKIELALCDENTALDIIMKDIGKKDISVIWNYELNFDSAESYDKAVKSFRSQIAEISSPNIS